MVKRGSTDALHAIFAAKLKKDPAVGSVALHLPSALTALFAVKPYVEAALDV